MLCHNPWVEKKTTVFGVQSASPLGVNTPQLNRKCDDGRGVDQPARELASGWGSWPGRPTSPSCRAGRSLRRVGRSRSPGAVVSSNQLLALPPVQRRRLREYRPGLRVPLEQTKTVGVRPIQGTFNIAGARIIAPGDPAGSVLYYRVSKLGGGRMPRVGSDQVDVRATRMIHDWIAGMPHAPRPSRDGRGCKTRSRGS